MDFFKFNLAVCIFFGMVSIQTQQLLVVVNDNWDSFKAQLHRFEKKKDGWQQIGAPWDVVVGRTGLAWGRGNDEFMPPKTKPQKREGDGKAPAGFFNITPRLYGYASSPPTNQPYRQLTSNLLGIDDQKSKYYNKIVDKRLIKKPDWNSFEHMRRKDHLYKWVMIIEHNTKNIVAGAGSCIFMHLWRSADRPTAGCTAMSEKNFLVLANWLKLAEGAKIVQMPENIYNQYRQKHNWPVLKTSNRQ